MCADLQVACIELFGDLVVKKQHALLRRAERIGAGMVVEWIDWPALSVTLLLWYFVTDLTDREVLILWEGSARARATSRLLPMSTLGFGEQKRDAAARERAQQILDRLQVEGLHG